MNVIRLMGGLGNQLFQYAFGQAMTTNGIPVSYDISRFPKGHHRFYMLDVFNIDITFSTFLSQKTIVDSASNPTYNETYTHLSGKNFFGYWQYLRYFQHLLPELRQTIWSKPTLSTEEFGKWREQIQQDDNAVSVHVRRDDYLTSDTIRPLPLGYYYDAFKVLNGNFYFFSDDIEWCKGVFRQEYFKTDIHFINLNYYHDFELMRLCKRHIIANSTFSWWAAVLDGSETVVTPNFWITKYDRHQRNNFPESWIKLPCNV